MTMGPTQFPRKIFPVEVDRSWRNWVACLNLRYDEKMFWHDYLRSLLVSGEFGHFFTVEGKIWRIEMFLESFCFLQKILLWTVDLASCKSSQHCLQVMISLCKMTRILPPDMEIQDYMSVSHYYLPTFYAAFLDSKKILHNKVNNLIYSASKYTHISD